MEFLIFLVLVFKGLVGVTKFIMISVVGVFEQFAEEVFILSQGGGG